MNNEAGADLIYFGVFDGHNGSKCAEYMKTNLMNNLCASINGIANSKTGPDRHWLKNADVRKAYKAAYN